MPDGHQGYGVPIGCVFASKGGVIPNAVGVDIGCGVSATSLDISEEITTEKLKKVMSSIRKKIPLGFNSHSKQQFSDVFSKSPSSIPIVRDNLEKARYQLGTLGGGNHFIEIQRGTDNKIWVMIHSGSRNFGLQIANYYHGIAKELCEKYCSDIPDKYLAFLPLNTLKCNEYLKAMNYALKFAKESRRKMSVACTDSLFEFFPSAIFNKIIDVHHNYCTLENHFGENVWVHRKGAISAKAGETGIIPGSQGTHSYIVKGKGNGQSFCSASHGAGRKMSRKRAIKELDLKKELKLMTSKNIVHSIRNQNHLDEAAGAYKDIDKVMANQKDLVDIVLKLAPLAVIKG